MVFKRLPQSFYNDDAKIVARQLIGKLIRREKVIVRITEVEAYCYPDDSANHARCGQTKRNAAMWGPGGHAYVYLCYGIHHLLNFVTNPQGEGAGVLIRSCEPIEGLSFIQSRRLSRQEGPSLLTGPGKVAQALGIDLNFCFHPLFEAGGLEVGEGLSSPSLLVGPRIGINYATPAHQAAPWRFALADCTWVSYPRLLSPESLKGPPRLMENKVRL